MLAHGGTYPCAVPIVGETVMVDDTLIVFDCAEAQRKSLHKLTTQKSHSFTGGVPPDRFDDMFADASPAGKQYVARRFDDVSIRHESPKRATEKLARQPLSISADVTTDAATAGRPCTSSGLETVHGDKQPQQKLAETLISHAVYGEVEQQGADACHAGLSQTHIRTGTQETTCAPTTALLTESHSHAATEHGDSAALVAMASCFGTPGISQQVCKVCESKAHSQNLGYTLGLHAFFFPAGA